MGSAHQLWQVVPLPKHQAMMKIMLSLDSLYHKDYIELIKVRPLPDWSLFFAETSFWRFFQFFFQFAQISSSQEVDVLLRLKTIHSFVYKLYVKAIWCALGIDELIHQWIRGAPFDCQIWKIPFCLQVDTKWIEKYLINSLALEKNVEKGWPKY